MIRKSRFLLSIVISEVGRETIVVSSEIDILAILTLIVQANSEPSAGKAVNKNGGRPELLV